jgi:hypothetical protein
MPVLDDLRRERFALLVATGVPQSEAYVRAGYRQRTRQGKGTGAWRISKRSEVAARIVELAEEITKGTIAEASSWLAQPLMDKTETLARMQAIGRADLRKMLAWGGAEFAKDGSITIKHANFTALIDSGKIDDANASAIAEVVQLKDGSIRLKLYDKQVALRDYAKLQGWLTQKHELSGADGAPLSFTIKVGDERSGSGED